MDAAENGLLQPVAAQAPWNSKDAVNEYEQDCDNEGGLDRKSVV